jgi:spore coat polysaccharide biosynthesis protein SpsF
MKNHKLIAALACRAGGSRLYGKPLQNIDIKNSITILDHLIDGLKACESIDQIVLGISEGKENQVFIDYAHKHDVPYILGSEKDVLWRLIQCARTENATDVFRITSEDPFVAWELVAEAWEKHVNHDNDVTVSDYMAEGLNFEIYTLNALEISHAKGNDYERSEFCSAYIRNHPSEFKIEIIEPKESLKRLDLRLTVDYPEDLVLCRRIYLHLKDKAPHIPVEQIINFLDQNPSLQELVADFVDTEPLWASAIDLNGSKSDRELSFTFCKHPEIKNTFK